MHDEHSASRVIRIEGEAEQTLFAPGRDLGAQIQEGIGQGNPVLDDSYSPGLFDDEETSQIAGRGGEIQGKAQSRDHLLQTRPRARWWPGRTATRAGTDP